MLPLAAIDEAVQRIVDGTILTINTMLRRVNWCGFELF